MRSSFAFSSCPWLRRTGVLALSTIIIGCGSSTDAPAGVTGVWRGRMAFVTQNDTFTFSFTQSGAEVQGWGILRTPGTFGQRFGGTGTLSGGTLDLSVDPLEPSGIFPNFSLYHLSGPLSGGEVDAVFEGGPSAYPITLRPFRPAAGDLAGTWVLTSTTGAAALAGLVDTIIASADGRAWRHREGDYAFGTAALWSRSGAYMVIDHEMGIQFTDSLVVQSSELQRSAMVSGGATRTEHYTRVSTAATLPRPS